MLWTIKAKGKIIEHFGNDLYQYLIVISLEKNIIDFASSLKKELANLIDSYGAQYSIPHITLASFFLTNERKEILHKSLTEFSLKQSSFKVSLSGFNFFDYNRVVFINVEPNKKILDLHTFLNISLGIDVRVGKTFLTKKFIPHITIGKQLWPTQFEKAKEFFSEKEYFQSFNADKLILLKKNANNIYELGGEYLFYQSHN